MYTRGIELPIEYALLLTKVLNPFKSVLESFVIIFSWFSAVEVTVNLLISLKSNKVPNNVYRAITKVFMLILLNTTFYV